MIRFLSAVSLLVMFALLLSCQSYSTGLQQSVARADETSAVAALRTIATGQQTYALSNNGSYGTFQQLCEGGFLDERFNSSTPQVKDYVFSMEASANTFHINADPVQAGEAAGRHLYLDLNFTVNSRQRHTAGNCQGSADAAVILWGALAWQRFGRSAAFRRHPSLSRFNDRRRPVAADQSGAEPLHSRKLTPLAQNFVSLSEFRGRFPVLLHHA